MSLTCVTSTYFSTTSSLLKVSLSSGGSDGFSRRDCKKIYTYNLYT